MGVLAENRKARQNYEIIETFEAGLVLFGQEVKSVSQGRIQLAGAYIALRGGELFLLGSIIPPYQPQNAGDYAPDRTRKLLVHKREIRYLIGKTQEKGLTLLPLKVYTKKAKIKLEFALARGKKQYDKRDAIRKRESKREIERALKRG
ncbi:MAG: SsrA-binding protein SmpB [Candidatus Wildermuthbacteria bacterium]|nr:SsrA-binding protein SmpB [Candidatus Wildermuthbacteria bacterium]